MSFDKNSIYALLNSKNIQFSYTEHRPVYSMEESDTENTCRCRYLQKFIFAQQ